MSEQVDLVRMVSDLTSKAEKSNFGILKKFETGDVIVAEDAFIRSIPIVTKGSLKVIQSDEDIKEVVLYYLRPGETCIMSFLAGLYNDTSKVKAVAEESSEVLFIPIDKVNELVKKDPKWLNYIFEIYHKRFEDLLQMVNDLAFKKMDERLLQFLKKRIKVSGVNTIQVTHEQIAHELGTAREVISRLLKKLEEEKLVELGRNRVTLL